MKAAHLLIGVVTLLAIGALVVWESVHLTSPGPLHPTHAAARELGGSAGCAACHGDGAKAMIDSCVACHAEIKSQVDSAQGMHGVLGRDAVGRCGACHREHAGASVSLVNEQSFAAVGVPDQDAYNHKDVPGFHLAGRHAELECVQCHANTHALVLKKDQKRFLGLSQDCASCHADPHKTTFGPDCVSCHGQEHVFKEVPGFKHTDAFPLEGKHGGLECQRCHEALGPHAVGELLKTPLPVRRCTECHADPHKGTLGNDCASCHGTSQPFDRAAEFKHTRDFPLIGGHSALACKDCHGPSGPRSVSELKSHPLPARQCVECHASPHRPALLTAAAKLFKVPEQGTCSSCHKPEHASFLFPAATISKPLHAAAGFSLSKPHDAVECKECHADIGQRGPIGRKADLPAQFSALFPSRAPQDCAACHKDPHAGQFAKGPTRGRCIECHDKAHFDPSTFDVAMHARSNFPLTGAHQAVACATCHQEKNGARVFIPTPAACAKCHKDVHNGSFDARGKPRTVEGREGCARCHTTASFSEITWSATDHRLWTGYELNGAHATAACTDCHRRTPRPDVSGRTLGVAPRNCSACHADLHAGQFRRGKDTDCARCHTESSPFTQTTFDHQRDSKFQLDEVHAALSCAACHKPVIAGDAPAVVRYRPLGSACQDCHDSRTLERKGPP